MNEIAMNLLVWPALLPCAQPGLGSLSVCKTARSQGLSWAPPFEKGHIHPNPGGLRGDDRGSEGVWHHLGMGNAREEQRERAGVWEKSETCFGWSRRVVQGLGVAVTGKLL